MRYCIVNGDDFGASHGIVRGILEANERGILTSTSLMVDMPASPAAAAAARGRASLGVGLHFDLGRRGEADRQDLGAVQNELRRQVERFLRLMDALPTHLDAHHNTQRRRDFLPCFQEVAARYGLPLREHSPVRYFPSFYGRWNGETHLEQISVERLLQMLENELADGITELSCHPGYLDLEFRSDYGIEREAELLTLCDPALRAGLDRLSIQLIDFRDVPRITRAAS